MSTANAQLDETHATLIGAASAVMLFVMLTAVGELALENIVYGAITGVLAGTGAFLFVPWLLQVAAVQDEHEELPFSDVVSRVGGNPQLSALGAGLEAGGIAMLAVGLGLEEANLVLGLAAAAVVTVAVTLLATLVFAR